MIKTLKLRKAIIALGFGIVSLIIAQVMSEKHVTGSSYVLGLSGLLLIIGALLFLYPILFAKKVDNANSNDEEVELKPIERTETKL